MNETEGLFAMNTGTQKWFAWGGVISLVMAVGGLYVMGFVPPPPPTATVAQIGDLYHEHRSAIALGALLFMASAAPFLLFIAVLSAQMKRIEGNGRTLTYLQLAAGATSMTPIILAPLAWCTAALRPDNSPEIIRALNDFGLMTMIVATPAAMAQVFAVALAVLADKSARPVFPRWIAAASFLCVLALTFGMPAALTQTGPFAWDGFVGGGLESLGFIPWTILMAVVLTRAIRQQELPS
jgi:hypothetical protein